MLIDVEKLTKKDTDNQAKWKERNKKIYSRYKNGETVEELCKAFNLSNSRLNEIIRQQSFKKLKKSKKATGGTNLLIPNIVDLDISAKTRNKLIQMGIYYRKELKERLPELEKSFSKEVIQKIKDVLEDI